MSTNYPGAQDDNTTLPNPGTGAYTNSPSHLGLHGNANDAIKALEAKVGTGVSTPPGSGYILTSSGTGVSSWQAPAPAGVWGAITGTLSSQTDLQAALNAKLSLGGDITGGTAAAPQVTATHLSSALPVVQGGTGTTTATGSGSVVLSVSPALTGSPTTPTQTQGDNSTKIASTAYVDALGSTTLVRNETPGGSINGSNVNFTTGATFGTGSLKVYLNGQRLAPGSGIDYVEVTQGFTMQYAPATGDVLLVDYETTNTTRFIQGSNSLIVQETPTGTVNGSTTLFTVLQGKYVANTLEVYLNGLQQTKTTDYTETSPGSGTFTFTTAPATGQALRVGYQFSTGASGNADTVDGIHASATPTANQLLALDGSARVPQAAIALDWMKTIFCTQYNAVTGSAPSVTVAQYTTGNPIELRIDTVSQNDELTYYVVLEAGTYKFNVLTDKDINRGIIQLRLSGANIGTTVDTYAASRVSQLYASLGTGIVIATGGLQTISLKAATKNASSSGYIMALSRLEITRTA